MFDNAHVLAGQKIADKLIKTYENADPRELLIGLAVSMVAVSKVIQLRKQHLLQMVETLLNALYNPTVNDAQEAASRLIIPSLR